MDDKNECCFYDETVKYSTTLLSNPIDMYNIPTEVETQPFPSYFQKMAVLKEMVKEFNHRRKLVISGLSLESLNEVSQSY